MGILIEFTLAPGKILNQYLPPLKFLRTDPCQSQILTSGSTGKKEMKWSAIVLNTVIKKESKKNK